MARIIKADVDGETVYIEVERTPGERDVSVVEQVTAEAGNALDQASSTITNVAKKMVRAIQALDRAITPEEFTLEFAIKFSAEGNAIVAKAAAEANLKVTMKYVHDTSEPSPGSKNEGDGEE